MRFNKALLIHLALLPLLSAAAVWAEDAPSPSGSQLQPGMEVPEYASPPAPTTPADVGTAGDNASDSSSSAAQSDESSYPPLSAAEIAQFGGDLSSLENKFYGHDFSSDSMDVRLNRIERMVYGAAKTGSIQERVTQLLLDVPNLPSAPGDSGQNVQAVDTPQANTAASTSSNSNSNFRGPQSSPSLKAEVSSMEQQVYGQSYPNDHLTDRVARLEKSVFANQPAQTFAPITTRINNLVSALQPRFSAPPSINSNTPVLASTKNANTSEDEKQKHGHPFLKKLGHALERGAIMAGESVGSMAMGSMMGGGYGYGGMGGYGGSYYGMGGYGPYGYGGFPNTGGMGYSW